jgi:hypothetical protein
MDTWKSARARAAEQKGHNNQAIIALQQSTEDNNSTARARVTREWKGVDVLAGC